MRWTVGRIPMPAPKVETESAQARRDARVAEYLRQRTAPPRDHLPLQGPEPARIAKPKPFSSTQGVAAAKMPRGQGEEGELRLALMRKMMLLVNPWRGCPARACRRHRRCASANLECQSMPARRGSPESEQAALAHFQRALARRLAQVKGMEEK